MKCQEFQKMISPLVDGELSEASARALRTHLDSCADCRHLHERVIALDGDLRSVMVVLPSSALAEKVKENIASRRRLREASDFLPAWGRVPIMAMLVLIALGLGNLAGTSLTDLITPREPEATSEFSINDNGHSFADLILDLSREEAPR